MLKMTALCSEITNSSHKASGPSQCDKKNNVALTYIWVVSHVMEKFNSLVTART